MITVIDSGIANIGSVTSACHQLGIRVSVTTDPLVVSKASALLMPGVGAFADGMKSLRRHNLVSPIREAGASGVPILGICLGMQLLAESSEEFGCHEGLGLVPGKVVKLQSSARGTRVPNIGWCDVSVENQSRLFSEVCDGTAFYFVHSFHLNCTNHETCVGSILYGSARVCVAVEQKKIFGVQFHPEKSQDAGLQVLKNFADISGTNCRE